MEGLRVATTTGADAVLEEAAVEEFKAGLRGELLGPGEEGYEEARTVWNAMIDKRPALIARCAGAADVIHSINFARTNEFLVAVRGGGHDVAGTAVCDRGLVIDLSPMKGIRVDPTRRTARAESGLTWGEFDQETQAFGLATTGGFVPTTGIAGLTLGGGLGYLMRRFGLVCDNLLSVDIVTAEGKLLAASETENEDLFWGIRGGGGNFGVVTSFEYQLHPVGPEVMFCFVFYPGDRAKEILRFYEEYMAQAPDEVSPLGVLGRVPRMDIFPKWWHGKPYVALLAMHAGDVEEGEQVLRPLRELGNPIADLSAPMPYTEVQTVLDEDYSNGWRYYWKSVNGNSIDDEVIEHLMAHVEAAPSDHSTIDVWYQGGAM